MTERGAEEAWRRIVAHVVEAQSARRGMLDDALPTAQRDEELRRYVQASDALVNEMIRLRSLGMLDDIAGYLRRAV